MQYKILLVRNRCDKPPFDFSKGLDWFTNNTPLEITTEEIVTDFDVVTKLISNSVYHGNIPNDEIYPKLRAIIPEGKYHAVIFIFGNDLNVLRIDALANEALYMGTNLIYLPVQLGDKGRKLNHEMFHGFFQRLRIQQIPVDDPMDYVVYNGVLQPYFHDSDMDAVPSNRSIALQRLSPYWDKVANIIVKNVIILGMRTLRLGDKGEDVKELQIALNLTSDGIFGQNTLKAVKAFQQASGLVPDGVVGALTIGKLKQKQNASKIDIWIAAITDMEGAKPSRNNPGNLRYVGQQFAIDDNGFCKFDTFQHGYDALKKLLVNACTGKSSTYKPEMTLYDFYNKYAPSSDGNNPKHYAEFVATRIGVLPTTQIKNLI